MNFSRFSFKRENNFEIQTSRNSLANIQIALLLHRCKLDFRILTICTNIMFMFAHLNWVIQYYKQ